LQGVAKEMIYFYPFAGSAGWETSPLSFTPNFSSLGSFCQNEIVNCCFGQNTQPVQNFQRFNLLALGACPI
jgi:hypothetical protein